MKKKKMLIIASVFALLFIVFGIMALLSYFDRADNIQMPIKTDSDNVLTFENRLDFDKLKTITDDAVAWLEIEGTSINYPVLQHKTNDSFYENHNIYGQFSKFGSIFIDRCNKSDFSDRVNVIYGHYSENGDMFGTLSELYVNEEGLKKYSEINLYLPSGLESYTVFAAVPFDDSHLVYGHNYSNKYEFNELIDKVYSVRSFQSVCLKDLRPGDNDKVIVLSTCKAGDYSERFLVLGRFFKKNS